jgi:uncharacterized membrane protein YidH (DUF202 family)
MRSRSIRQEQTAVDPVNGAAAPGDGIYRAESVQRRPWSPAQILALAVGILFVVAGGIALARTGIHLHDVTAQRVTVAGVGQTQLLAYIEIGFGVLLLLAGSIPGASRSGMSFLGVTSLVFGIIVVAQPSTFTHPLGIDSSYGVFLIVVGAVVLITAMVAPVYGGVTRRARADTMPRRHTI